MALTGIDIYKKLPKTNCKECGFPTCLAFAMSLAAGKTELEKCPYVSDEAKAFLAEASAPPQRTVIIGKGEEAIKVGGETVMFRHEKTFVNKPAIAILITDTMSDKEIEDRINKLKKLQYERVGLILKGELVCLKQTQEDSQRFLELVNKVKEMSNGFSIILMSKNVEGLIESANICSELNPLLYAATKDNVDEISKVAKEKNLPVVAYADNLDELVEVTNKLTAHGIKDIILDSGSRKLNKLLQDNIIIRRAALLKKFRPLGFPTIVFPCEMTDDYMKEMIYAASFIAKYGGIIVLSDFKGEGLFPLLLERMNIFTDPQRPMVTKEGIYEIGNPDENSPVLITSNFSLTYFIVSGEIETSRVPSYLLVKDTEGLSVMTAWAAGKFSADTIAPFVKKCGIEDKVKHRKIIIPGYTAAISGELSEELPQWEVKIGPREASAITAYLKLWGKEI